MSKVVEKIRVTNVKDPSKSTEIETVIDTGLSAITLDMEATQMSDKPYVWQMIKEAVESLGGKATYSEIKDYIWEKYGKVNESTINCQIIVCTVNHPSRIHYPENKKPRVANSRYDFLFSTG